jgi:glycosyltransferase involved in cell wall biosynthesis
MENLNFYSQFYGILGIPIHARYFADALIDKMQDSRLLQLTPPDPSLSGLVSSPHDGITQKLKDKMGSPILDSTNLVFWYPQSYKQIPFGKGKRIGYYIFEYTKISKSIVETINTLDAICTASKWGVEQLKANGVTIPCHVIPGGVDSSIFNSSKRNLDSKIFRFLHVGKKEERKGTDLLIRSFNKAFQGNRKVKLSLYIDNPHVAGFNSEMYLHEIGKTLQFPYGNIDVLHFYHDITDVYAKHHCAVFPTRAEGIGLPIVEAMACGVPTIASFNSGVTEFATDKNAILLKNLKEMPVYDPVFFPVSGENGVWNTPTEEELIEKMLWVYNNYGEASKIGDFAEKDLRDNYSWSLAAEKFKEIM